METIDTLAIGIDLALVPTAEGGRETPLLGDHEAGQRFTYRANWSPPGWSDASATSCPAGASTSLTSVARGRERAHRAPDGPSAPGRLHRGPQRAALVTLHGGRVQAVQANEEVATVAVAAECTAAQRRLGHRKWARSRSTKGACP